MDITPIYELRDRLRTAMIAGTNLLAEDFRLKRAVEALAPLEKAAPVFAKVGELSRKLIEPGDGGKDGKEGILLDAITLVDAVCCTQGTVGVSGELTPVFTENADSAARDASAEGNASTSGMVLSNVPYSTLQPLREALTTSGSGHYSFVTECHRNNPALFKDYRVRAAMVQALGASYGELADDVCDWLLEDGADVAPLLMRGFDPKGKKEMVRRVQVIDKWMGAAANDFYIEQLKTAEGELRQNLVFALRHSPENIERLESMRKTEKGNTKRAVYYALACNDNEKVQSLFEEMYQKKPIDTMNFLHFSQAPWAARLAAKGVTEQLLATLEEKDKKEKAAKEEKGKDKKGKAELEAEAKALETSYIAAMEHALFGKCGPEVCEAISAVAKRAGKFESPLHASVLDSICSSLIREPKEDLLALASQLYEGEYGNIKYFPAAFLAKLISQDSKEMLDWLEAQLFEKNPMVPFHFLATALRRLVFDEVTKEYSLQTKIYSEVDARTHQYMRPVRLEERERFIELLVRCNDSEIDGELMKLFDPADKEVCAKLEEYFFKKALARAERDIYLYALNRCGCTRCEGLLVHYAQVRPKVSMWELEYYVRQMPGTLEAKMAEAARIPELVKSGKVHVNNWNEEGYMRWVQNGL
ncbi:MAG: hypothetical protein K2N94_04950 [Lachnospiraceae bacterium]|nr:hypothetical protein [Lachnospiraceae bacterium]